MKILQPYFYDSREYFVRFAMVMLLFYYVQDDNIDRVLEVLKKIQHWGYYAKMAAARAVSVCYVQYPQKTMRYVKQNILNDFIDYKALQKIIELRCVKKEEKEIIRNIRRKPWRS